MLHAIGLEREAVYITNAVPWQPPANRTPTPDELALCLPFLHRHLELVKPHVVLLAGGVAAQALLGTKGVLSVRGRWFDLVVGTMSVQALVTLHPSYLLRQPAQKRLAWHDMKSLRRALASSG
jgi:DNA polymerase